MFTSARLKLTAWYLAIIMAVSLAFSLVVYNILMREVYRFALAQRVRIERRWAPFGIPVPTVVYPDPDLVDDLRHRILLVLTVINSGILLLSGGLGYVLAGRTLAPIRDMVDEQNRFISDASHELRTPLTALKSAIEVFLRDPHPRLADAKTLVTESLGDVNKLQSLSESLMQLAQFRQPADRTRFTSINLKEVVDAAVKKITPLASRKKISLSLTAPEFKIMGDKYSLVDLLIILLDNAVKYSPQNSAVLITVKKNDGSVIISVVDHGIGISAADLPHVFDRFYRADTARGKSDAGGFGLGLAIAKKIVESHSGTISVTSRLGSGSAFTVSLPDPSKPKFLRQYPLQPSPAAPQ